MVLLRKIGAYLLIGVLLASCQLGYIAESAYHQADLLRRRVPLQYALDHYKLTEEERSKIKLTMELRNFMKTQLDLDTDSNFSRYVHLERPYVTYAVNASPKDELKQYRWSFPLIGSVPYKGYFKEEKALAEAKELEEEKNLDTHVRGVSAYSTLGWFEDPLLSSMLRMKEHDFVNTLIHETVHANLYIESHPKFNERVASFLGQLGTEAYYKTTKRSDELNTIVTNETHDELLFSNFITAELKQLREWYKKNKTNPNLLKEREIQFKKIQERFSQEVLPKMKSRNYQWFPKKDLNNAFLVLLELYNSDFSNLEIIANHYNRDFKKVLKALKFLEEKEDPEKAIHDLVKKIQKK